MGTRDIKLAYFFSPKKCKYIIENVSGSIETLTKETSNNERSGRSKM